ncbi:MAG: hypothetical protein KJ607_07405 [Bacteroidetes bacterium]|nr:hypothetical protein [Bacteroidota bacterium]
MKTIIITVITLLPATALFGQKNDPFYLDFFGKKYYLEYEIQYAYTGWSGEDEKPAKDYLLKIIDENKNCNRFMLKDIYYFDFKADSKYYLGFEILLYR